MLAVDFFHVDCALTLKRIYVFFTPEVRQPLRAPERGRTAQLMGGRRSVREAVLAYALLIPSAIIFAAFFFYPLYRLVYLGLHQQYRTGTAERYVGLSQFTEVLTGEQFTSGLRISVTYVLLTMPLGIVLGILLAVAANRRLRGIKFFRTVFASTVASSVAVASVVFFVLINPQVGYFSNVWFLSLSPVDRAAGRGAVVGVAEPRADVHHRARQPAGRARGLLEAARLDATAPRNFFSITLPLSPRR